ncbi:SCO family protein [Oceaniglobus ichthyenteri]|uniref:SCO family protein n=1 Tax=Oceaniglobus ichthyenteri TaxID=2136177 RepID=UPI000D36D802|nr:SCO family protein [Oceaniglobus ichthyenteri]
MIRVYAIAAVVALLGMLGALWWYVTADQGGDLFAQCRTSQIAGGSAAIGGPFTLVSETGETVTDADVITKPSLIYFGYTFCPDVCPMDAARNAFAVDLLAEMGHDVQPVFISIDPARDTPEVLAKFTDFMHPDMLGLTGSPEQVKAASQAYKTYYAKRGEGDEFYLMDHSVFTYLVLPEHGFVEFFRGAPTEPGQGVTEEEVAKTTACYIDAAS